jgi:hypothetical protein
MIDWVHRYTTNLGPTTEPTGLPGLSSPYQLMLGIPDRAYRGRTFRTDKANFTAT